jgi:hypothetical protein
VCDRLRSVHVQQYGTKQNEIFSFIIVIIVAYICVTWTVNFSNAKPETYRLERFSHFVLRVPLVKSVSSLEPQLSHLACVSNGNITLLTFFLHRFAFSGLKGNARWVRLKTFYRTILFRNPIPTMSGLFSPFPHLVLVYTDILLRRFSIKTTRNTPRCKQIRS